MSRFRSLFRGLFLTVSVFPLTAALPGPAQATTDWTPEATEATVMRLYYEGLPFEVAQELPPAATAHLGAILADPERHPYHANAMLALGISGHPGTYEILLGYELPLEGELSRQTYRALVTRQIAMGHLGRNDERAVAWLVDKLQDPNPEPGFSYRALRGTRLARELRGQVATALALSGSSQAQDVLRQLRRERQARGKPSPTDLSIASLDAALADLERIREMGPERALASPFSASGQQQASPR